MYQKAEIFSLNIANTPREKNHKNIYICMILYSFRNIVSKISHNIERTINQKEFGSRFLFIFLFFSIFLVCWLVAALCWGCRSSRLVEASSKGIANDPRGAAVLPRNFFLLRTPWIKVLCSDYDWSCVCINSLCPKCTYWGTGSPIKDIKKHRIINL